MSAVDVTYPPLDTLKPFADGVWIVDSGPMKALGAVPIPVRMAIFKRPDGGLILYSPTRRTSALAAELAALGRVDYLLAPSSVHWTFVKEWQAAHPQATVLGAPGLSRRAPVRRSGLRIDGELSDRAPLSWGGGFETVVVPGIGGFAEVALFQAASRTLALCDLVQNFEGEKLPPALRLGVRLAGGLAPDGRAPAQLRAVVRLKGGAARRAAGRVAAFEPERVVFAHGKPFSEDGARRLRRSLRWLLT